MYEKRMVNYASVYGSLIFEVFGFDNFKFLFKKKAEAYLSKHGKINLPVMVENKLTKKQVIDTNEHTIIVSDLSASMPCNKFSDSEEDELENAEIKDAEIFKSQSKISKECSIISERLAKLESKKKNLEKSNTKTRKSLKAARAAAKNSKASKKFEIKTSKFKNKKKLKMKKKLDKLNK